MILTQIGILCSVICISVAASYYFFRRKLMLQGKHRGIVNNLEMGIEKHQRQLSFRDINLNKYHFMRYNLGEALVEQPEINT